MQVQHRIRVSVGLMLGSLLVLGGFLVFWLQQSYEAELRDLQQESHYLFLASAREIEDSLLQALLTEPLVIRVQDSLDPLQIDTFQFSPRAIPDSSKRVIRFVGKQTGIHSTGKEQNVSFRVTATGTDSANEIFTFLSMFAGEELARKTEEGTLPALLRQDSLTPGLLENHFRQKLPPANLKVDLHVIQQGDSNPAFRHTWTENSYFNPISGENFTVELGNYRPYLLGKLWPQLLFSILLLAGIGVSFWLVYRTLQQQRRLSALKNEFVSNITHELKTPITTVSVAIEALRNFQALRDPARTEEYLDISQNELKRLSLLVDRVLRMSQLEQGAPQMKRESLDLQELLDKILHTFKLRFEQAEAQVHLHFRGDSFRLPGDRGHLNSVIYNLIDNALKYSSEKPKIDLLLVEREQEIELQISDQGIGIEPAYQKKVFEKFFRVPSGNQHNVKGHGLGLNYVAQVVAAHEGTITLESRLHEGTRFVLRLPKQST